MNEAFINNAIQQKLMNIAPHNIWFQIAMSQEPHK